MRDEKWTVNLNENDYVVNCVTGFTMGIMNIILCFNSVFNQTRRNERIEILKMWVIMWNSKDVSDYIIHGLKYMATTLYDTYMYTYRYTLCVLHRWIFAKEKPTLREYLVFIPRCSNLWTLSERRHSFSGFHYMQFKTFVIKFMTHMNIFLSRVNTISLLLDK